MKVREKTIKKINKLIGEDKILQSIKELSNLGFLEYRKILTQLEARLVKLEEDNNYNIITIDEYNIQRNRIRKALIDILFQLETDKDDLNKKYSPNILHTSIWIITISIIGLLTFSLFYKKLLHTNEEPKVTQIKEQESVDSNKVEVSRSENNSVEDVIQSATIDSSYAIPKYTSISFKPNSINELFSENLFSNKLIKINHDNPDYYIEIIGTGEIIPVKENSNMYYYTGGNLEIFIRGKLCASLDSIKLNRTERFGNLKNVVKAKVEKQVKVKIQDNRGIIINSINKCLKK